MPLPSISPCIRILFRYSFSRFYSNTGYILICLLILSLLPDGNAHAQAAQLRVRILDALGENQIHPYTSDGKLTVPGGQYNIQVLSEVPVARMRMQALNSRCSVASMPDINNGDDPNSTQDDNSNRRFRRGQFTVQAADSRCRFKFDAWHENYQWAGDVTVVVVFGSDNTDPNVIRYAITQGSGGSTEMDTSSPIGPVAAHGTRVYCPVSHYSFDDPIVHPERPNAAHLHMFWGNTATNAFSTLDTLFSDGLSSCEGGLNNKSAYWMPALFNEQNEVVLPESVIAYYKSFPNTAGFDRNAIMPIPDGLQMLANQTVSNSGPWNFSVEPENVNGQNMLRIRILFPQCLKVTSNNIPRLSSRNNTAHLSYANAAGETSGDCPATHPYRIPQLSYNIGYNVPINSAWYLASDDNAAAQGQSLHADYIAAWDDTTMNRIVQCNRESRRACEFVGYENGQARFRDQLPERFLSPEGVPVYSDSVTLSVAADRTPFGTQLTKMSARNR